ncbi:MAG: hypothetical protein H0Z40_06655 [Desulfotomaculum sp.]|nr:hypothetical protein [Desulfotomaculum sp.]
MSLTEIYVYKNSIYIIGKVKNVRKILAQYALDYGTVKELIGTKLN